MLHQDWGDQDLAPSAPIQKTRNVLARDGSGLLHSVTHTYFLGNFLDIENRGTLHVSLRKEGDIPGIVSLTQSQSGTVKQEGLGLNLNPLSCVLSLRGRRSPCHVGTDDILESWHIFGSFILVESFYGLCFPQL